MDGLFVCVRFLATIAILLTLALLYSALFKRKLPMAVHLACLLGICTGMSLWLIQLPTFLVPQRLILNLLAELLVLFLYKNNFFMGICVALIHYAIGAAMETVFLPAVLILFRIPYAQLHSENLSLAALVYLVPTTGIVLFSLWIGRILRKRERHLELPVWEEEALATISVKNTSALVSVDADGEVETTKKLRNLHGFGLKTCRKILNRSGFDFVVHYQNGWFQFTAIEVSIKLADGGILVQSFTPHPVPHEKDGGAEVLDKFGFTWYLST